MDIDLAALRMIEADKGIPVKDMIDTIRQALLSAYRHTEGHQPHASIDIDEKTGAVSVIVKEIDEDGAVISEYDDTPRNFGRVAATTARQVILQRLRDAENDRTYVSMLRSRVRLLLVSYNEMRLLINVAWWLCNLVLSLIHRKVFLPPVNKSQVKATTMAIV